MINYIVLTIGAIISYLNNALIYCKITNNKMNKHILYILLIIIMGIINSIVSLKLPIVAKPTYNVICLIISIYFVKKEKFKSILYYVFMIWLVGITLDIIFMALFSTIFNYLMGMWPNFGILIISIILQIVLNIIFRIKWFNNIIIKLKNKLDLINNNTWLFLVIISLVIFFAITAFSNVFATKNILMILALLFIVIFLFVFLVRILYEEKTFKITIDNLLMNNKYYLEANTQDRIFRHNIIHQINSIKSVGDKKTNKLIDELIADYKIDMPNKHIDNLPNGINGIISRIIYSRKIDNLNIAINNYLESDLFDVLTHRKYNKLCETLGICLDNALSAVEKSKEKILQIVILENEDSVVIKIINTFKTSMEVDKIGSLNYTTKKEGHGLGLYSLFGKKDVVLKASIINNMFENHITTKKNKTL